jgi:hypothetical protein
MPFDRTISEHGIPRKTALNQNPVMFGSLDYAYSYTARNQPKEASGFLTDMCPVHIGQ